MMLLNWATRSGAWIIEDDYDSEYRFGGRPIASLQGLDTDARVIYIGTFNKVVFPSLRLGYVVVSRKTWCRHFAPRATPADIFLHVVPGGDDRFHPRRTLAPATSAERGALRPAPRRAGRSHPEHRKTKPNPNLRPDLATLHLRTRLNKTRVAILRGIDAGAHRPGDRYAHPPLVFPSAWTSHSQKPLDKDQTSLCSASRVHGSWRPSGGFRPVH